MRVAASCIIEDRGSDETREVSFDGVRMGDLVRGFGVAGSGVCRTARVKVTIACRV